MEMLETEARQSLKAMLTIGVDSWKNLNLVKTVIYISKFEDQREVDEPGESVEMDLRVAAVRDLGEDFTDEDFVNGENILCSQSKLNVKHYRNTLCLEMMVKD